MTIKKKYNGSSEDEDLNSLDEENDDDDDDGGDEYEDQEEGSVQEKEDDWPIIPTEVQILIDEAFNVQRILKGVLSHLTFPDLLGCRLVDTKWEKNSTQLLTTQNCAQVSIEFYWLEEELNKKKATCLTFRNPPERWKIGFIGKKGLVRTVTQYLGSRVKPPDIPYEMEKFSLRALSTILQNNPTTFPCSSFTLWDADLGNAEIQRFFQIQGSQIQSLRLCSANPDSPFTKVPLPKSKNDLSLDLPILKYLTWTDWDKKSVLLVMRASPNLTVTAFQDDSVNYLDTILLVKKVTTVKRLKVSTAPDATTNLSNYSENIKLFAKAGPQVQTLEFGTAGSTPVQKLVGPELKLCNKLKANCIALLEACKDSIENLSLDQLCAYFELKSLPKFRNLKKLSLAIVEGQDGVSSALFPPQIDLRESFPRLQCLELRAKDFDEDEDLQPDLFWDAHFPPSEPFRGDFGTVKVLEMDVALCTDVWLHKIYKILCPHFTTLVLNNCTKAKLERSLPKIFEMWTHLEILKLHFGIGEDLPSLDEEFTGFSKEFIVQGPPLPLEIHSNGVEKIDDDSIEKAKNRVNGNGRPSVCDLKELKTIEIWTTGQAFFADDLPLTQNSLQYISKMMPDLKVGLHIRKNSTAVDHNHFLFG